jgi:F-type H+-transporting ATPase subunit epsilon
LPPKLRLDIVTAERVVYTDEVDVVIAPGADGELSILPRHAPLLTMLQPGELRIRKNEQEIDLAVSGGFLEVEPDRVIVLADTAERADEIDTARAAAAAERAEALIAEQGARGHTAERQLEFERAAAALRRSKVRLKVARRRGQPAPPQGHQP